MIHGNELSVNLSCQLEMSCKMDNMVERGVSALPGTPLARPGLSTPCGVRESQSRTPHGLRVRASEQAHLGYTDR